MKKLFSLAFGVLLLNACNNPKSTDHQTYEASQEAVDSVPKTPIDSTPKAISCNCEPLPDPDFQKEEISLSAYDPDRAPAYDSMLRHTYNSEAKRNAVTHIHLEGYARVPEILGMFKNVTTLSLFHTGDFFGHEIKLSGLDIFPHLRNVLMEGCHLMIDTTEKCWQQVEQLHIVKAKIKGVRTFKQLPQLKSLRIAHSGFDVFPADFNTLQCLQNLYIEEYKFGALPDARQIDLLSFKCLRNMRLWGGITGLPKNIDGISNANIVVRPWALNDAEREKYRAYQQRLKHP